MTSCTCGAKSRTAYPNQQARARAHARGRGAGTEKRKRDVDAVIGDDLRRSRLPPPHTPASPNRAQESDSGSIAGGAVGRDRVRSSTPAPTPVLARLPARTGREQSRSFVAARNLN